MQVFEFVNKEIFQIFKFHNEKKSLPPSTLDVQSGGKKGFDGRRKGGIRSDVRGKCKNFICIVFGDGSPPPVPLNVQTFRMSFDANSKRTG